MAAEFYRQHYTDLEDQLDRSGHRLAALGSLGRLFTGPFGSKLPSSLYDTPGGVPLLRVQNIGNLIPEFDTEEQIYVGERIVRQQVLNELAIDLVNEAKADVEALIEGTLVVDAILAGALSAPTTSDIPELSEEDA